MCDPGCVLAFRLIPSPKRLGLLTMVAFVLIAPRWSQAQGQQEARPHPSSPRQDEVGADPQDQRDLPALRTITVPRDRFNGMVNASLPLKDKQGAWVLDFAYKPLRIKTVNIPGKGRRQIYYLYYKVVNRTGAPRVFVPRFVMVNDKGEKFEDKVVPQAMPGIQAREDPAIPLRDLMGVVPTSVKPDVDYAVYGVATWERWDPAADRFSIYVRGLSDGYEEMPFPIGGKPSVKYKTLKIDFTRNPEIRLVDPPHEWVYW